jgi:hypothetical protein
MQNGFFDTYLAPVAYIPMGSGVSSFFSSPQVLVDLNRPRYKLKFQTELQNADILGLFSDQNVKIQLRAMKNSPSPTNVMPPSRNISTAAKHYLVFYYHEDFRQIASLFNILSVPRSTLYGVLTLRLQPDAHFVHFIDIRKFPAREFIPSLPSQFTWSPHPQFKAAISDENESCISACDRLKPDGILYKCTSDHFVLLNECTALMKYFPCERGCRGAVSGLDVPNYVTAASKPDVYQACLTTEDDSTCGASHWSAKRLCPCIPA